MQPSLIIKSGPDAGKAIGLDQGVPLVIGREPSAGIYIADQGISRKHCQVEFDGEKLIVTDLKSTNGTIVEGRRIDSCRLEIGGKFRVGASEVEFVDASQPVITGKPKPRRSTGAHTRGLNLGPLVALQNITLGQFSIHDPVASGASGVIFKATDNAHNGITVAVKVLWPEFLKQEEDVKRLVRGVKTMIPIQHPNLVALYGAGKTDGYGWVSMEYVPGKNVAQVLRDDALAGKLEWKIAFDIALQTARALEELHAHDIVHRNLTPRHIIVREPDKVAKLCDHALAKALSGDMAIQLTHGTQRVGEASYMSPEQTFNPDKMDIRSDIYGLGATIYALLAGDPPFVSADNLEMLRLIRGTDPTPLDKIRMGLPEHFTGVIHRMMAKQPENRYETPSNLVEALERVAKFTGMTV